MQATARSIGQPVRILEAGSEAQFEAMGTAAGGAVGPATSGNSFITWTTVGDRRGPLN